MARSYKVSLLALPKNFDQNSEEWSQITLALQSSLKTEGDFAVSRPRGDSIPRNAKGEPITTGAFIIALVSAPAIVKLASALNTWLSNLGKRQIEISLEIGEKKFKAKATGFSKKDIEKMVEAASKQLATK